MFGPPANSPPVGLEPLHRHLAVLKQITQRFIIHRADFAVIQRGQQTLLKELLACLKEWTEDRHDRHRLPSALKEGHGLEGDRAIIDYVAALSDLQAAALHRALRGGAPSHWPRHSLRDLTGATGACGSLRGVDDPRLARGC